MSKKCNPPPALARGLNRRLAREIKTETQDRVDEAIKTARHSGDNINSRKAWYRRVVMELESFVQSSYVGTATLESKPKQPACLVLYLDTCDFEGRLQLVAFHVDARTFTIEPKVVGLYVSRHALERIFQRLKLNTPSDAMREVLPVVKELMINPVLGEFTIRSDHGLFTGNSTADDSGQISAVITTFIDNEKLRPDQQ